MPGADTGMLMQPIWHCTVILQSESFDLLSRPAGIAIDSQSVMATDIMLPGSWVMDCIGHCPAEPLAASPVKGSTAQSHKTNKVRRIFTTASIAQRLISDKALS